MARSLAPSHHPSSDGVPFPHGAGGIGPRALFFSRRYRHHWRRDRLTPPLRPGGEDLELMERFAWRRGKSDPLRCYLFRGFRPAITGAGLFALGLDICLGWNAPAVGPIPATLQRGFISESFDAVRLRWGTGHLAPTFIKPLGFVTIALRILRVRLVASTA
jgi:hypothetical protein